MVQGVEERAGARGRCTAGGHATPATLFLRRRHKSGRRLGCNMRNTHTHTHWRGREGTCQCLSHTAPLSLTVLLSTVRRRNTRHGGGGRRRRGDEAREPCLPQAASSHNNSFHRFTWRSWRSCRYCRCSNIGQWAPLSGLWDSSGSVQCSAVQCSAAYSVSLL